MADQIRSSSTPISAPTWTTRSRCARSWVARRWTCSGCTTVYGDTRLRARLAKRRYGARAGRDSTVVPGVAETVREPARCGGRVTRAALRRPGRRESSHDGRRQPLGRAGGRAAGRDRRRGDRAADEHRGGASRRDPESAVDPASVDHGRAASTPRGRSTTSSAIPRPRDRVRLRRPDTVTGLEITTTVRLEAGDVARIARGGAVRAGAGGGDRAVVAVLERGVEQPARPDHGADHAGARLFGFTRRATWRSIPRAERVHRRRGPHEDRWRRARTRSPRRSSPGPSRHPARACFARARPGLPGGPLPAAPADHAT